MPSRARDLFFDAIAAEQVSGPEFDTTHPEIELEA
jgi:hypothetical protein